MQAKPNPTSVFGGPMLAMLGMVLLVGLGERMAERFLPLYLGALGAGAVAIGNLNAMTNFLGGLYAYPGGWLTDHWGQRKSLLLFSFISSSATGGGQT